MGHGADPALHAALQREIDRLAEEFRGTFSREAIERCARDSRQRLGDARVAMYLPAFVYRFTRERLKALATVEGLVRTEAPSILFVCVHNANRSQMAAALAHRLSGGRIEVHSAGSQPAGLINPIMVEAMAELGLELSAEFPKPLTNEVVAAADVVVTMGCGDACPLYPFKKYEDWPIEDPDGQPIERVREIRDAIRGRVGRLLAELGILDRVPDASRG